MQLLCFFFFSFYYLWCIPKMSIRHKPCCKKKATWPCYAKGPRRSWAEWTLSHAFCFRCWVAAFFFYFTTGLKTMAYCSLMLMVTLTPETVTEWCATIYNACWTFKVPFLTQLFQGPWIACHSLGFPRTKSPSQLPAKSNNPVWKPSNASWNKSNQLPTEKEHWMGNQSGHLDSSPSSANNQLNDFNTCPH